MTKQEIKKEFRKAVPLTVGITSVDTVADWWLARIDSFLSDIEKEVGEMKKIQVGDEIASYGADLKMIYGYKSALDQVLSLLKAKREKE